MLKKGLSGNQLKLIAVIVMLIDHIGFMINQQVLPHLGYDHLYFQQWVWFVLLLRSIGRIAFPLFCFVLVEGFLHTSNWKRYAARLGIFALISEVPFNMMISGNLSDLKYQNVLWTLLLGLLMLAAIRQVSRYIQGSSCLFIQLLIIILSCVLADLLKTDYSYFGVMLIAIFYWYHQQPGLRSIIGYLWMLLSVSTIYFGLALLIPFGLLYIYNGERGQAPGGKAFNWFFYWFYPVHMIVVRAVCLMIIAIHR